MDKKTFSQGLKFIELSTDKVFTTDKRDLYYLLLKDIPDEDFMSGIKKLLSDRVYTNIPAPAEIINYCVPKKDIELESIKASETIRMMVKEGCRIGNVDFTVQDSIIAEIIYNLGGLKQLSRLDLKTYEFTISKKVPELYKVLANKPKTGVTVVSIRDINRENLGLKEIFIEGDRNNLLLK